MKKLLVHSAVWLVMSYFLFLALSRFLPDGIAVIRTLDTMALMAGMFYLSGWVITPRFLIKRKNIALFIGTSLLLVIFFSVLRVRIMSHFQNINTDAVSDYLHSDAPLYAKRLLLRRLEHTGGLIRTGRHSYLTSFITNAIILVIAMLIRLYDDKTRKEQESREKLQHSQEAQILYLKSQVNPHFLFNTLNNLYGLTYSKSDLAPQMVLGLSDTMRYLIYETEQKLVPVEKELDFVHNYLDLEKMRISHPENIRTSIHISQPGAFIPPLLLLPFIENCFKHGTIGKEDDGWMELDIWDEKDRFYFVCKNNFHPERQGAPIQQEKASGLGLSNVKKRLEIIYGEQYQLQTIKHRDEFLVSLQFQVFSKKDER